MDNVCVCCGAIAPKGTRDTGTESLWTAIDEQHDGTKYDPIPASRGMEYTYGLYYTDPEDNKMYLCERVGSVAGGVIILQYLPHELVGQYFSVADYR